MGDLSAARRELEAELEEVISKEEATDVELTRLLQNLTNAKRGFQADAHTAGNLAQSMAKIESFTPWFEAAQNDTSKLVSQIDSGRVLADRVSDMVRRLDDMQIRAQKAMALVEDIINLKDCRQSLQAAIDDGDLRAATSFVKQFHDIDQNAATASKDYGAVLALKEQLQTIVRDHFNAAVKDNDIDTVMSLCPLLQTLGLQDEARDVFLDFLEENVFVAISADTPVQPTQADDALGYAESLSAVFNAAFGLVQDYLPRIIQGMEASLGDVYFIRRLHKKVEKEAGQVLKRYVKFRSLRDRISKLGSARGSTSPTRTPNSRDGGPATEPSDSGAGELHSLVDELALLVQYCEAYVHYVRALCEGAEKKGRDGPSQDKFQVLPSITAFDGIVAEMVNTFYLPIERHLINLQMKNCVELLEQEVDHVPNSLADGQMLNPSSCIDEAFFVLQRCGTRAVATQHRDCCCAVLIEINNCLTTFLLGNIDQQLAAAVEAVIEVVNKSMAFEDKRKAATTTQKAIARALESANQNISSAANAALQSAAQLASSLSSGSRTAATSGAMSTASGDHSAAGTEHEFACLRSSLGQLLLPMNDMEVCVAYTARLHKELATGITAAFREGKELEQTSLCLAELITTEQAFNQSLRSSMQQLCSLAGGTIHACLQVTVGEQSGIRYDLSEEKFDTQPAVIALPGRLVHQMERLLSLLTAGLSPTNSDRMHMLLSEWAADSLEKTLKAIRYRFAGAIKMEEYVRAVIALFGRRTAATRSKFSRLRELLSVLTTEAEDSALTAGSFNSLSDSDIVTMLSLRLDLH